MIRISSIIWMIICFVALVATLKAQTPVDSSFRFEQYAGKFITVTMKDGTVHDGQLLEIDAEKIGLLINNKEMVQISIAEIQEMGFSKKNTSYDTSNEKYALQYFGTLSYLNMEKGKNYMKFTLFGPEIYYVPAKRLTIGARMSWLSAPILVSGKYSFALAKKVHVGAGCIMAWGSYFSFGSFVFLPHVGVTVGDERKNISLSYGQGFSSLFYGAIEMDKPFTPSAFTLSGLTKLKDGSAIVFEFMLGGSFQDSQFPFYFFMPGLRIPRKNGRSFQAGLGFAIAEKKLIAPIPTLSWYFKL